MDETDLLVIGRRSGSFDLLIEFIPPSISIQITSSIDQAIEVCEKRGCNIVLCDNSLAGTPGLSVLEILQQKNPDMVFILITERGDAYEMKQAFRQGAHDVLDIDDCLKDPSLLLRSLEKAQEKSAYLIVKNSLEKELFSAHQELVVHNETLLESTDRLRLEQLKLEEKNRELSILTQNMDDFLSVCSHDLRSPISTIRTICDFFFKRIENKLDNIEKDFLGRIIKNADYCLELISKLLDTHELEKGGTKHFEPIAITPIVNTVSQTFMFQIRLMDLNYICIDETDEIEFHGDRIKLTQLFNNLMVNAIKFTPKKGTIRIEVGIEKDKTPPELVYKIFNSGSYIAPENRKKIFNKFEQINKEDRQEGHGLGLAICKGVCELHGGNILVESTPDVGTTFIVRLPIISSGPNGSSVMKNGQNQLVLVFGCEQPFVDRLKQFLPPTYNIFNFNTFTKQFDYLIADSLHLIVLHENSVNKVPRSFFERLKQRKNRQFRILLLVQKHDESLLERYYPYIDDVISEPDDDFYLANKLDKSLAHPPFSIEMKSTKPLILLVEGNLQQSNELRNNLNDLPETVGIVQVMNGYDALMAMRKNTIDLVIANRRIPIMDGFELLTRMKMQWQSVPVFIYSNEATTTDTIEREYFGVDEVFNLPSELDRMLRSARKMLEPKVLH